MSYSSNSSPPPTPPTSDSETGRLTSLAWELNHCHTNFSLPSSHPFAASTKADRAPPAYEKKPLAPLNTLSDSSEPVFTRGGISAEVAEPYILRPPSLADDEQKRWDAAISSAVDGSQTKLDLSSANLTYIPSSIIDLQNLVVLAKNKRFTTTASPRPFIRSTTAPALLPSPQHTGTRPFLPSQTTNRLAFGGTKHQLGTTSKQTTLRSHCEVELYLMRNAIRTLPRELFALDCLVVLSLRQNKLTSVPPAIGQLTQLRELNIANNRLTYLPAQIQNLHLMSLQLYPNPFIPSPLQTESEPTSKMRAEHKTTLTRVLGPLKCGPSVPKLSELILRHLLAPVTGIPRTYPPRTETRLETAMTLAEIDKLSLPAHIRRVIFASTGHGRNRVDQAGACVDAEQDMSSHVCPCPSHRGVTAEGNITTGKSVRFQTDKNTSRSGTTHHFSSVFYEPVEERIEWVSMVAGVQVAESPGAWVPLLWRGCGPGCLAFLDGEVAREAEETERFDPLFEAGRGDGDEEFQFSDEE